MFINNITGIICLSKDVSNGDKNLVILSTTSNYRNFEIQNYSITLEDFKTNFNIPLQKNEIWINIGLSSNYERTILSSVIETSLLSKTQALTIAKDIANIYMYPVYTVSLKSCYGLWSIINIGDLIKINQSSRNNKDDFLVKNKICILMGISVEILY